MKNTEAGRSDIYEGDSQNEKEKKIESPSKHILFAVENAPTDSLFVVIKTEPKEAVGDRSSN